jgi:hypothetical protein
MSRAIYMSFPPLRHVFNPAEYYWVKTINYKTVHCVAFSPVFSPSFFPSNFFLQSFRPLSAHDVPYFLPSVTPTSCALDFPIEQFCGICQHFALPSIPCFTVTPLSPRLPSEIRFEILFSNILWSKCPHCFFIPYLFQMLNFESDLELLNSAYIESQRASRLFC